MSAPLLSKLCNPVEVEVRSIGTERTVRRIVPSFAARTRRPRTFLRASPLATSV